MKFQFTYEINIVLQTNKGLNIGLKKIKADAITTILQKFKIDCYF